MLAVKKYNDFRYKKDIFTIYFMSKYGNNMMNIMHK